MRVSRAKSTSVISALAVAGLLLTGCAGGQSKADACKTLESGITDLQSDLQSSLTDAASDPKGAADSLQTVADTFSENADKVTNDEVKKPADKADEAINRLVDEFKVFAEDPTKADTSKLTTASTDVQTTFTDLSKVCN